MDKGASDRNPGLSLSERELFERVGWFTLVRWGAGALAVLFILLGRFAFEVRFDVLPATATVIGLFIYNAVFSLWVRHLYRTRPILSRSIKNLAHAQITCDLLAVAALVHFIGGVDNHFVVLFLFPMIVASEFFPPAVAYGYATLAAVLVNIIGWGEHFGLLLHHPLMVIQPSGRAEPLVFGASRRWMFDLQVCVVMTFALYATVFIAASIAGRLRSREEELERTYRNLQSLEQIKSQFMLKAGHELKSPIATVRSLLQAASIMPSGDARLQDVLGRAMARCINMTELIDDLLHYSRLRTATPVSGRFEVIDMAEIIRAAADLFRAQAQEKSIQVDTDARTTRVRGDRDSLADLVNNLLSNALRYTPECGRISVVLACEGEQGRLVVSDTGIGIPAEELPHIFDEFFRGREARRVVPQGTGLGMTIVQRVVDMHHWEIATESTPGKGTTFRISMPCIQ